jgi:aspartate-semialdehyde dehydrogenase
MDDDVPLIVPEVNAYAIDGHKNIIANPNCSTIQAVVALNPIYKRYGIKRIVYSTYQAVSGAGLQGFNDLKNGLAGLPPQKFPKPIASNVIPHIDVFLDNGYTKEEMKMVNETRKILGDHSIRITSTAVRVPVYNCHSESINVETSEPFDIDDVKKLLSSSPGVVLMDDIANCIYPTTIDADGRDETFVGRVRRDESIDNGLNMWVVADNIRKGAATNAVQIAEILAGRLM